MLNRPNTQHIDALTAAWNIPSAVEAELSVSGRTWAVACSGGCDSVAALLWAWSRLGAERLVVAHFDHGVRGAASAADARWVGKLADLLSLRFISGKSEGSPGDSESKMRDRRNAFLAGIIASKNVHGIITGHHAQDVVETVLLRLVRGASLAGLSAPRPVSLDEHQTLKLRPLLNLGRGELEAFVRAVDLDWREDASNADDRYARNFLRHQVLPKLEELADREGRSLLGAFSDFRREVAAAEHALSEVVKRQMPGASRSGLELRRLRDLPEWVARRTLSEWICDGTGSYPARSLAGLIWHRVESGETSSISLSPQWQLVFTDEQLCLEQRVGASSRAESVPLLVGAPVYWPSLGWFSAETIPLDASLRDRIESRDFDPCLEALLGLNCDSAPPLRLSTRRPGLVFRPLGAPGAKKLKDVLIDRKIPLRERDEMPIVLDASDDVVWRPSLPPAEACKVLPEHKYALRLTYTQR